MEKFDLFELTILGVLSFIVFWIICIALTAILYDPEVVGNRARLIPSIVRNFFNPQYIVWGVLTFAAICMLVLFAAAIVFGIFYWLEGIDAIYECRELN